MQIIGQLVQHLHAMVALSERGASLPEPAAISHPPTAELYAWLIGIIYMYVFCQDGWQSAVVSGWMAGWQGVHTYKT